MTQYTSLVNGVLLTNLLAPRESGCSRMRNKVSFDWLPSYITATRPVLEIYKMVGYFPDRPRTRDTPLWGRYPRWKDGRC